MVQLLGKKSVVLPLVLLSVGTIFADIFLFDDYLKSIEKKQAGERRLLSDKITTLHKEIELFDHLQLSQHPIISNPDNRTAASELINFGRDVGKISQRYAVTVTRVLTDNLSENIMNDMSQQPKRIGEGSYLPLMIDFSYLSINELVIFFDYLISKGVIIQKVSLMPNKTGSLRLWKAIKD